MVMYEHHLVPCDIPFYTTADRVTTKAEICNPRIRNATWTMLLQILLRHEPHQYERLRLNQKQ